MANILLSYVNHVDNSATVLSASQSAGDLSIENVRNPIIGRRWRTTSLTAYGQADFGANKSVGVLALVFPRDTTFPTSGTVRHTLDADGGTAGSGAAYDSTAIAIGTVDGYGYHVHILANAVSARYWRWTFNVSGVSYVDTGRAWAGEAWTPSRNFAYGHGEQWDDLSQVAISPRSGAEFVDSRPRRRAVSFALPFMSSTDRDTARELQRICGLSTQLLACRDPDSPAKDTIVGRLAEVAPITQPGLPIFSTAFRIRESL